MQILGLLGMYFDAVVVCRSQEEFTFIQIGSGHTVVVARKFQARSGDIRQTPAEEKKAL